MSSNTKLWIALVVVAIIAVTGLFKTSTTTVVMQDKPLGGVTNYDELTLQEPGLSTTTLKVLGNTAGTFGGCIAIDATSTATHGFMKISTLGATTSFAGAVLFGFGTCE